MIEKKKQCSKCKERKLFSEFCKKSASKDGFRSECKKCKNIDDKEYQQTDKGKQTQSRANKKYYHAHRVERAKYQRKYHQTLIGCLRHRFAIIKHRCNNPEDIGYKNYGGRGIKCKFKSLGEFVDYVLNELKADPRGLAIDRIDNDGHYEPGNIRFVTRAENNQNRRKK